MTNKKATHQQVNSRNIALTILQRIFDDAAYTNVALDGYFRGHSDLSKQDRAFITRLVEGTVEHVITLDYIIDQFSKTKTKKMKKIILYILRLSVYQIKYMDKVPISAICNEAVKLAKKRKFHPLSGFVNGVLRNIVRGIDEVQYPSEEDPVTYLSIMYSFPTWLVELWLSNYPYEQVKAMCEHSNCIVDTSIRSNRLLTTPEALKKELQVEGITVKDGYILGDALHISQYDSLRTIDAFAEGKFTVQDESSMLVGHLARPEEGQLIVDVCAAPGGKTTHVAELLNQTGRVISRDIYPKKLELIEENVKRLHLKNVDIQAYNALEVDHELVEQADIVLADVPCSGLGIIRKKPDIRYNVSKEGIEELVKLQRRIITVVEQYVKPGGTLIYSTCTVNKAENIDNVNWFLEQYPYELVDISQELPEHISTDISGTLQLLPGAHHTDGFYIAKLKKRAKL